MAQKIEENLLQAIKKDDIKAFDALMDKTQCGTYRLGRFPVLSLLYLYKARKILSAYEETFLRITGYVALPEPIEISGKFSSKAGKCLRLYFNEVVSPLEMLLILHNIKRLKQIYPKVTVSSAVKERLKSIYYIRYGLGVRFEGNDILFDRRPLTNREKRNIATVCICVVMAILLFVVTPITAVSLIPKPIEGEATKLKHIDFASTKEYTLKKDIVVPKNYTVDEVNCTIIGEGHKLIFRSGAKFKNLNGKISNLTIESNGNAIFDNVNPKAIVENVVINANVDIASATPTALFAMNNYGTIEGVTVNAKGKIKALATSDEANADFAFGGIVQINGYKYDATAQMGYRGIIKNCNVNYSQFNLIGVASANASFGGVAGINDGYLQDCKVGGEIAGDTFDIAGVCCTNNGLLSGNVNEAKLSQVSADTGWNPIVSGIVLTNAYAMENCQNKGSILSVSTCGKFEMQEGYDSAATAVGVAYLNRSSVTPSIVNCSNFGNVECRADYRNAYAAGVCVSSSNGMESCNNGGAITAKADNGCDIFAGGITAMAYGYIYKSKNTGAVSATGNGEANVGGISAHSRAQFLYCISSGEVTVKAKKVYAGGIFGFSEAIVNYNSAIRGGTAEFCISQCKINVTTTDGSPANAGGIAGCVRESSHEVEDTVTYFGGAISNCYFIGECKSNITYFGNIVGAYGANVYESNSYTVGNNEYYHIGNNYYLDNSLKAIGATINQDGSFAAAEDKGAERATLDVIENLDNYKSILNAVK
ncbi:MAG: hypothetical protein K2M75_01020 [Clostridia bacterium]|nr:hypothetical protein [Clostridia bacterium]